MELDFYEQRFTRSEVAEISEIKASTLRGWMQRGIVDVSPHHKGGTGNHRLYSPFDIVKVATLAQLSMFNVPPSTSNDLIKSKSFKNWVSMVIAHHKESHPDSSQVHLLIFMKSGDQYVANYIAGKTEWDLLQNEYDWFTVGSKGYFTLKFGYLIEHVTAACKYLILQDKDPAELTEPEKAILAMREHIAKTEAGENGDGNV